MVGRAVLRDRPESLRSFGRRARTRAVAPFDTPADAPSDPHFVQFFSECDLLIHEAQYFPEEYRQTVGWGHSSSTNAAALLQKTKIPRWLVVHHDPQHSDTELKSMEKLARSMNLPCSADWIGDGHVISLK